MGLTDLTGDAGKKKNQKSGAGPLTPGGLAGLFPGASIIQIGPNGTSRTTPPRTPNAKKAQPKGIGQPKPRKTFGED